MEWFPDLDLIGRLLIAAALGLAIAFERERDGHQAGTRTFATVAIGAALFGVISTAGFEVFVTDRNSTNVNVEVTRVASQVVVGIGFLGAGLISRRGSAVHNLTTAATLWTTAAVGLAAGIGSVGLALIVTVLTLVILTGTARTQRWLLERAGSVRARIRCTLEDEGDLDVLTACLAPLPVVVDAWRVEKEDGHVVVDAGIVARRSADIEAAVRCVVQLPATRTLHQMN